MTQPNAVRADSGNNYGQICPLSDSEAGGADAQTSMGILTQTYDVVVENHRLHSNKL
jgi:hypothetical protein